MTRLFQQWIFSFLMTRACSKMTMPGFIGLKLWKRGSGSMRHHFYTCIGHLGVQSQTVTPLSIFGMWWRRLFAAVPSSIQDLGEKFMQLWRGINVVTFQKVIAAMQRMCADIKAKVGPTKVFLDRQCILTYIHVFCWCFYLEWLA